MSDRLNKRYYWLKLDRNFFKRHDITIIENMPNGKDYILFYLKMLCESIDHNGELRFSETIPYSADMLSAVTHTNIDIVRTAVNIFKELGMLEIMDNETIYMTELEKMVGSETGMAKYMRDRKKSLPEPHIDVDDEIAILKEAYGDNWIKHLD